MLTGHGGNIFKTANMLGCKPSDITDMSSNVNPIGPMPGLLEFIKKKVNSICCLPEVDAAKARIAFAERNDISDALVIAGNGTTEFIYSIPRVLKIKKALILGPTYADYADACIMNNIYYQYLTAVETDDFKHSANLINSAVKDFDAVFICNPNNPTGTLLPAVELEKICRTYPDKLFIIDESYLQFINSADNETMANRGIDNIIVLNSMSKIFRIPGLRIGFMISSADITEKIRRAAMPWTMNVLAQAAVIYLMEQKDEVDLFIDQTRTFIHTEQKKFLTKFKKLDRIKFFPGKATFILAKLYGGLKADLICERLLQERILIRNCANFAGLSDQFIRFSLQTSAVNDDFTKKFAELIRKL